MKALSFLAGFGKAKAAQAGGSIIELIVRFDPETASEAQISEFEQELTQLTSQVAQVRREYQKEKDEADAIVKQYNQYLAAAENLQAQANDPVNADKKDAIEKSLAGLLGRIEGMVGDVEREKQEAEEAKAFLDQLEQAAEEAATKVTSARAALKGAQREMASAALSRQKADKQAEQSAVLAGLRSRTDSFGTALSAMKSVAQKDRDSAAASGYKAQLLTKNTPTSIDNDPLVAAALGTVKGDPKPAVSLSDRLAALKKGQQ